MYGLHGCLCVITDCGWYYSIKDCRYSIEWLLADLKTSVILFWGFQLLLSVTGLKKVLWTHKSCDWLWRKRVVLLTPSELLGYFLTARTVSNCKFNVLSQAAAFMQPRRFPFVPTLPALPLWNIKPPAIFRQESQIHLTPEESSSAN